MNDLERLIDGKTEWAWKMDYCKKHELPPAQSWAWNKAKQALLDYIEENYRRKDD